MADAPGEPREAGPSADEPDLLDAPVFVPPEPSPDAPDRAADDAAAVFAFEQGDGPPAAVAAADVADLSSARPARVPVPGEQQQREAREQLLVSSPFLVTAAG